LQSRFFFFTMKKRNERGVIMLFRNIRYVCKLYFRSTRSIFVYLLISMAALLLTPVLSVYLPKVVVQAVTEGWAFERLVLWVGALVVSIALLNIVSTFSNLKYDEKASMGRLEIGLMLQNVMMDCPYVLTEDPVWQTKIEEAGNYIFSDGRSRGVAGMIYSLQNFTVSMMGVFTFSAILGILHPAVLVILVFTCLVPGLITNRLNRYGFEQRENWLPYDKQINYIYHNVTAAKAGKEVRLYRAGIFFLGQMEEAIRLRLIWARKIIRRYLGADGVATLMLVLQNGFSLGWIAYEIIRGRISVAEFTFYSGAVIQFTQFMNRFVQSYGIVKQCSLDVGMVREALEYLPEDKGSTVHNLSDYPAPEIRFEHVTFSYPGSTEPVLKDINFCVRPGEKVALVGANGAGKTTLVKLLCGLYQPAEGRILIDGIPTSEIEEGKLFGMFSAVFQDMLVLPFSVLDNVAVTGTADVERVRGCLEKAGLSGRFPDLNQPLVKGIQDGGENLSGGEEQKLLLARALYKEAPVLVLDEPTAALDPLAESELYGKYNQFTHKKTSFFISHRLASTGFCDRILLLGEGRILEQGSHRELLDLGGQYAHMFHEQSKYYEEVVGSELEQEEERL
jgi:ATP-binding cassette subfamily B protein